ncbi:Ubiquinol-cytochrome c reductase iron-sulfur subunit [Roseovarius albus]|uniref:Ubiquinol-cytochrome c reductase iron-sulfur subunit n=1 Tax=Roseovarius albus TaxID=1247867 RepID=A0A1X6YKF3_9RHOB|nr:Rieske 2Fe-2S domain-containing protein [Roseovarius albus]SLN23933.1 Ubiquinol-cytochrome c reductase iron-sulfur subunit [Roseovarius albus]
MQRRNFLYIATSLTMAGGALYSCAALMNATAPTADITARRTWRDRFYKVDDFAQGEVNLLKIDDQPLYIWHRSNRQISEALAQDNYADWPDKKLRMAAKQPGLPAYDTLRTNSHRWLAVWAMCTWRGCLTHAKMGDYSGFFCPCCGAHYDMAGRFRKGLPSQNLAAVPLLLTETGDHFTLNLKKTPDPVIWKT